MLTLWINRALESLWLLVVFLVPLAFIDRDYISSEAVIAYVEVPKVALLRTLVGLMTILWLVEWGIRGRLPATPESGGESLRSTPGRWFARLRGWLGAQPVRWLFLAVWSFLAITLLSTVLSGSFSVSMWGEVPGQDGYAAYTILAYVLLFSVIATRLKSRAQLWRLLGTIVAMGVLVSGYGILQHYKHDFLNLTEFTGGGAGQVTSFMGNDIFAAAVMMMTVGVSVMLGTSLLRDGVDQVGRSRSVLRGWLIVTAIAALWGLVLAVQLLGITFTFARGPWVAIIAAIAAFLALVPFFVGWRFFTKAASLLALSMAMIMAVLLWQGSISSLLPGPLLGALSAAAGLAWVAGVFAPWRLLSRATLALGLAGALALALILGFMWIKAGGGNPVEEFGSARGATDPTGTQLVQKLSSTREVVLSGFGGRGTHWKVSWELIRDRPWFSFDNLSLPWLRPLIGYGPDLFRYTYLLRSPPEGQRSFPLEPDHAHNFFIHQTVEQGILGLISTLAIVTAVFVVGSYQVLRQGKNFSTTHRLILIGLLAVFAGRFLEMMVGVARVSDMTVLWVLVAIFAALPKVMQSAEEDGEAAAARRQPPSTRGARSHRRSNPERNPLDWRLFWRLAIVAWIIGGIGMLTWLKSINYVRAAVVEGQAIRHFDQGEWQATLASLNRAIELAPDVSVYHNRRAKVYLGYQIVEQVAPEQGCSNQNELPYRTCLAIESFQGNLEGARQRPFYHRSRLALADSAFNLKLDDEAIRFYEETLALVPGSWALRNALAEAYIQAGRPDEALPILEESLAITQNSQDIARTLQIQLSAYHGLGDSKMVLQVSRRYFSEYPSVEAGVQVFRALIGADLPMLESLAKTLGPQTPAVPKPGIQLALAGLYGSAVQQELERVTGIPLQHLSSDMAGVATIAKSLVNSSDSYLQFNEPELGPRFLFLLGLAYLEANKTNQAAIYFQESGRLYLDLDQQERAATAFTQEVLAACGASASPSCVRRVLKLTKATISAHSVQQELSSTIGSPNVDLRGGGLPLLEQVAQSLLTSDSAYRRFSQPELAPRFLFLLALAYLEANQTYQAAIHFQESGRLSVVLDQPERAAAAFTQELLIYEGFGLLRDRDFLNLLKSSELYHHIDQPDVASRLHMQLAKLLVKHGPASDMGKIENTADAFYAEARTYWEYAQYAKAAQAFGRSAEGYLTLGSHTKAANALFRQGLAYSSLDQWQESVESLERSLALDPTASAFESAFKNGVQELNSTIGSPNVDLPEGGLTSLEQVAQSLPRGNDVHRRFSQPELAPRFLFLLALAYLEAESTKTYQAAIHFQESGRLSVDLDRPERAATAFTQELLIYEGFGRLRDRDFLNLLKSSEMYNHIGQPDVASRLHVQLAELLVKHGLASDMGKIENTADAFYAEARTYWEYAQYEKAAQAFGRSAKGYLTLGSHTKEANALFRQGLAYSSLDQWQKSVEPLERSLALDPTASASRLLKLNQATISAHAVQQELSSTIGSPNVDLRGGGLPLLEKVAQSLLTSNSAYRRFSQPELAPRFLFLLGLAFLEAETTKTYQAAIHFQESGRLYVDLDQPERAATAFTQEVLAYDTFGRLRERDFLNLDRSSLLYDKLYPPELAARMHLQLGLWFRDKGQSQRSAQSLKKSAGLAAGSGQPARS